MNKEEMQKSFDNQIVEKINFVCTKKCWSSNVGFNINKKLKAGKKLDLYRGDVLDDVTIDKLKALHELEFYDEIKIVILEKTGLGHLFEEIQEAKTADVG